jgi:methylenetetrahydrofolate dehydrogenase (NADP+)/methenyltetrahydrofolate cyclohydrolase
MSATLLDGRAAAAAMNIELAERVAKLRAQDVIPGLATVLIGNDPGSHVYVRNKHTACEQVGIHSVRHDLPADASRDEVLSLLHALNADPAIDGYIIQHPVPAHLDFTELLLAMDPAKDADGLHPMNLGYLALGERGWPRPCTPEGIVALLVAHHVPIAGRHVVVIGRGPTVGRPLAMLLSLKEPHANATVTQCHTGSEFLPEFTRHADIVVAAAGKANMLTADMIKPGAAVVDVGITRTDNGIVGDVAPDVWGVAGWVSPVPGGVGPMTIAMLMRNTIEAAERRAEHR